MSTIQTDGYSDKSNTNSNSHINDDRLELYEGDKLEVGSHSYAPFNFPKSRQNYATAREARKAAEVAKPTRSQDQRANKKGREVSANSNPDSNPGISAESAAKPSTVKRKVGNNGASPKASADAARPTTVYDRSRNLRANRKARKAGIASNPGASSAEATRPTTVYDRSRNLRSNRKTRKLGATSSPGDSAANAGRPTTVHERSQNLRANRKARKVNLTSNSDAPHHDDLENQLNHNIQTAKKVSSSTMMIPPMMPEDEDVDGTPIGNSLSATQDEPEYQLSPSIHHQQGEEEAGKAPTMPEGPTGASTDNLAMTEPPPVESSETSPFLIEARIVEEPDLVHAEQVRLSMHEKDKDAEEQDRENTKRSWQMVGAFVLLLVMTVGILVGVLLAGSNTNEDNAKVILFTSSPSADPSAQSIALSVGTPANNNNTSSPTQPHSNIFDHSGSAITNTTGDLNSSSTARPSFSTVPTSHPSSQPSLSPTTTSPTQFPSFTPDTISFLPNFTLEAIAKDSNSPQAEALSWVQAHPEFQNMTVWRKQQLLALCTLYYATGGETSWNTNARRFWLKAGIPECQWHQESECTKEGQYQKFQLDEMGLKGKMPPEISLLRNLTQLYARDNELEGSLPTEMGQLRALTILYLQKNAIDGELPTELGQLTDLILFGATENALTGPLPSELGRLTAMIYLHFGENALEGVIPSEIGQLTALTGLGLRGNALHGTIPSELGHLKQLSFFDLPAFNGAIPSQLGLFTALTLMALYRNALTGPIPSELGQLTALTYLSVHQNIFNGTIPSELGQLTALTSLTLSDNAFSGQLPSELGQLTALTYLGCFENALTGALSSQLGQMTALTKLSLRDNQLTGSIPSVLAQLTNLVALYLYGNDLSGAVPSGICGLPKLTSLTVDCDLVNCTCSQCTC